MLARTSKQVSDEVMYTGHCISFHFSSIHEKGRDTIIDRNRNKTFCLFLEEIIGGERKKEMAIVSLCMEERKSGKEEVMGREDGYRHHLEKSNV